MCPLWQCHIFKSAVGLFINYIDLICFFSTLMIQNIDVPIFKTFQQNWKVFMHSVCLFVCPHSNSRKYSSNVLKFIYVSHIWYRMNRLENDIYGMKCSSTETRKSFLKYFGLWEKIFKASHNICILNLM